MSSLKIQLSNLIRIGNSQEMRHAVMDFVGNNPNRFDALMDCITGGDTKLAQYAMYPFGFILEKYPELGRKHIPTIMELLKKDSLHTAFRRNITRVLQYMELPEEIHGELIDQCFRMIENPRELPAVKANAIGILERLYQYYPEIANEITLVLEENYERESPAFRSRAKKLLRILRSAG